MTFNCLFKDFMVDINAKSAISGFVLAGGKSSRMGFDKAFLWFDNKPLLKNMIDLIDPLCASVAISGQNPAYADFGLEIIPDDYPECGPISGIYSVLKHSSTNWNLVVGVDMPFLTVELFRFLISHADKYDGVIPIHQHGIEPLAGLYSKHIGPVIEDRIREGKYKLTELFSEINTCFVDCNSLLEKSPKLFCNMNSREDYLNI